MPRKSAQGAVTPPSASPAPAQIPCPSGCGCRAAQALLPRRAATALVSAAGVPWRALPTPAGSPPTGRHRALHGARMAPGRRCTSMLSLVRSAWPTKTAGPASRTGWMSTAISWRSRDAHQPGSAPRALRPRVRLRGARAGERAGGPEAVMISLSRMESAPKESHPWFLIIMDPKASAAPSKRELAPVADLRCFVDRAVQGSRHCTRSLWSHPSAPQRLYATLSQRPTTALSEEDEDVQPLHVVAAVPGVVRSSLFPP